MANRKSKSLWERFEERFSETPTEEFLLAIGEQTCYEYLYLSTVRYNLMDFAYKSWHPGWDEHRDTRAHRLVSKKLSEEAWDRFYEHMVQCYDRVDEKLKKQRTEDAEARSGKHEAYMAQQKAERIRVAEEDWDKIQDNVRMTSGLFLSDLHATFQPEEAIGSAGDFIHDPVDALMGGDSGWAYDKQKAVGTKLQITLSLDLSNSMVYNRCHVEAAHTFRDLGMLLKALQATYQDSLFVSFYEFSKDSYWGGGRGKNVERMTMPRYHNEEDKPFGEFGEYRPSAIEKLETSWRTEGMFTGTDTYFAPLFSEIEKWEREDSDAGAVKLDIVLTDAVMEHPGDIREASTVQTRRDGRLQTVFLNFLPEDDWADSSLPKFCYQVPVTTKNVGGILRQIMAEFIGAQI